MNTIWTPESTKKLIELLHTYRYVWDRELKEYGSRYFKAEGLAMIASALDTTAEAIRRKLMQLKSAYKNELLKIQKAKERGFTYTPTVTWFHDFKALMDKEEDTSSEPKNDDDPEDSAVQEEDEIKPAAEDLLSNTGCEEYLEEDSDEPDTIVVSLSDEYLDGRCANNKEVKFIPKQIPKRQYKAAKQISEHKDIENSIQEKPRDEFQMFADHVAEQLRKLPPEEASTIINEIQNIMDDEQVPINIKADTNI